jgi:hypothetical protein
VFYWSEFLATDPEARVRFPALPEKRVVGLERGSLSLVSTTEELLDRRVAAPVQKTENTAVGIRHADHVSHPLSAKVSNHVADKRRSHGRYSSLADSDHGFFFNVKRSVSVTCWIGPFTVSQRTKFVCSSVTDETWRQTGGKVFGFRILFFNIVPRSHSFAFLHRAGQLVISDITHNLTVF